MPLDLAVRAEKPPLQEAFSRAVDLGEAFAADAARIDEAAAFPRENLQAIADMGLLALPVARERGGWGGGLGDAIDAIRAIARGEPSTALILAMHYMQVAQMLAKPAWPPALAEEIVRRSIAGDLALMSGVQAEPDMGSPSRGGLPATIARQDGDGWRISGRKTYVTGAPSLGYLNVSARTDELHPRIGNFIVRAPDPGVRIVETWRATGMRGTASHDVVFEDVLVERDHALDLRLPSEPQRPAEGAGRGWYFGLIAAVYDGIALAARDWLVQFLRERAPSSLGAPLATVARVQEEVGRIETQLAINTALLNSLAQRTDRGIAVGMAEAGIVKSTVTANAITITAAALALTGNHGLSRANPLERHHRNALCGRIQAPQDDTILIAVGRAALGL